MDIRQKLVDPSKYNLKCPYAMSPTRIVVHNTENDASADNEIQYMITNNSTTSFHIAVDNIEAVQGLPLNRNGWHAGDGNGAGNRQGIGIEICYSKSGGARFNEAEARAATLIAQLLVERGWGLAQVTKHQDYSGKYCPRRTLDLGWDRFLNMVASAMNQQPMSGNSAPAPSPEGLQVGDTIHIKGLYIVADTAKYAGIYQIKNSTLAGGSFSWLDNGIPETCVDLTNSAGIKRANSDTVHAKKNDYFNFPGTFKIVEKMMDNGKEYLKLDFNNNVNYQFWVIEDRCIKV